MKKKKKTDENRYAFFVVGNSERKITANIMMSFFFPFEMDANM